MIYRTNKKTFCGLICFIFILTSFTFIPAHVMSSDGVKEGADIVLQDDQVRTGALNSYTRSSIIVNNVRFNLCVDTLVFNPRGDEIPLSDINAAEEVKLFENQGCIRKIKVLRFAH